MTNSWTTASVAECLEPLAVSGKTKIQARDYKLSGRFPVIDQGQEFIAGWTDDEDAVISESLPVIVFGDHTRIFKLVDRPFARGADGTQLLKPKEGIDTLFFYYACKAIDLPARGYNRHFTLLKEKHLAYPLIEEQRAIGSVLRQFESAFELQSKLLNCLQEIKVATMSKLFTGGLRGEMQKETDIGQVPESWAVDRLGAHHSVVSGATPSRDNPAYWSGGTIPWVKTTEVAYCVINETEERITPKGLAESSAKLLPAGTLLMAMYGQGVTRGKVAILGIDAACNQACAAIAPNDNAIQIRYLYHFLSWRYEAIRSLAHGGQQQNLNLEIVRDLPIAYPISEREQIDIVSILDAIDRKIELHQKKRDVLSELSELLLQQLMTAETSISELELLESPVASAQQVGTAL